MNSTSDEPKLSSSNTGPRVDVYAPASNVISAVYDETGDPGIADSTTVIESAGMYQKYTGTSIGAAQVSGVLALALETYPKMTASESKTYITSYAQVGKMYATNSSNFLDTASLQGGNNRFLYYNKERSTIGFIFPKINYKVRPTVGVVFPRTKIRRT